MLYTILLALTFLIIMNGVIKNLFDKVTFLFNDVETKTQVLTTRVNILQAKVDGLKPTEFPDIGDLLSRLDYLEGQETF